VAMAQCVSAGWSTEIVPLICSGLSQPIEIEKVQVFGFDSPVLLLAGSNEAFVVCSSVWQPGSSCFIDRFDRARNATPEPAASGRESS
jgi:hypothetical protein